jgi:ABC-2 type transport system ATP-binding protein
MRQRLGIAAAMLGDPPTLLFDEPYSGMDPEGIVWMEGFLHSLATQGRAVLVSSHLMSELEDTATHLVVVGRGKVIADTSVSDLIAAASGNRITLRTTAPAEAMTVLANAAAEVAATASGVLTGAGLAPETMVSVLNGHSIPFSEITVHRATLKEAYMERAGGNPLLPVPALTLVRMVVGTAAMFAVAAVIALAIGAILRLSAEAVATVIVRICSP